MKKGFISKLRKLAALANAFADALEQSPETLVDDISGDV